MNRFPQWSGIGILIILAILILMTFSTEKTLKQPATSTPTGTVTPTATIPPAMATKGAVVKKSLEVTPAPPQYYPFESEDKIADVVFADDGLMQLLEQDIKDATAGQPVKVKRLDKAYEGDYYLIPFWRNGHVIGIAQVNVSQGMGRVGVWSGADMDQFPPLSRDEVLEIVKEKGFVVMGEPELVFYSTIETGWCPTSPQWRVLSDKGYVFIFPWSNRVYVFLEDELHPAD